MTRPLASTVSIKSVLYLHVQLICLFATDPARPTVNTLMQHLIEVRSDWFLLGIALKVPRSKLREIEVSYPHEEASRWMIEMLQYWLDSTPTACWDQVASALKQIDMITLASKIRETYHLGVCVCVVCVCVCVCV